MESGLNILEGPHVLLLPLSLHYRYPPLWHPAISLCNAFWEQESTISISPCLFSFSTYVPLTPPADHYFLFKT